MRSVSWNLAKRSQHGEAVLQHLDELGAELVLLQESKVHSLAKAKGWRVIRPRSRPQTASSWPGGSWPCVVLSPRPCHSLVATSRMANSTTTKRSAKSSASTHWPRWSRSEF